MTRTPRPVSARVRILGAILAVACVGLAIVGSVTFVVQRERVLEEVDDRLDAQVEILQTVTRTDESTEVATGTPLATADPDADSFTTVADFLDAAISRIVPPRNEASLAIIDGIPRFSPRTLTGFDISGDQAFIDRVVADTASATTPVRDTVAAERGSLRFIAIPVQIADDPSRGLYVRAIDLDAELEPVTTSIITYSIAAGAVLLSILVVGWFVAGRLLSPLPRLRDTADSITLTDLGARLPAEGNDDITDLTRTVNSMLDRLEGSVDVQRQLLDDVRHELKTPITIVRGHLELMDPHDVDDVASTRDIGIAELDRMTRLVEDIDLLAAVDGEDFSMKQVDVDDLTDRVGELVAVIPAHTWSVQQRAHGVVLGDEDRLLQAWLAARRQRLQVHAVRLPHRDRQRHRRRRGPTLGEAITDPASHPRSAGASSAASTARRASARWADPDSGSRSSRPSPRRTAVTAPSATPPGAARSSRSTCLSST